tara:strand:+ start:14491 stop:15432 length:942 start_codon:yes stop_codon:yes gene_type:complete
MNENKDYYNILGVNKSANYDDIKKAFRRLSLELHPDRTNNDPVSTEKFKEMNEAWEVLQDETKRREYDLGGNLFNLGEMNHTNINPEDILKEMFGNMSPFSGNIFENMGNDFKNVETHFVHIGSDGIPKINIRKNISKLSPTVKRIKIPIESAFTGCNIPIKIERWITDGDTKTKENETLYVKIPSGIDENEIIILKDKGNIANGAHNGDVKIFVTIENKTDYTRKGLDLIYHKTITLKEALCGFSFNMKYIDGRNFQINNVIGNIIVPGFKKLIPNMGMKRDDNAGNLIIEFTIIFPENLSSDKIQILKENL